MSRAIVLAISMLLGASLFADASAQAPPSREPAKAPGNERKADPDNGKSGEKEGGTVGAGDFENWGTGLALIRTPRRAIAEASIVNGIVRVNSQSRYEASVLLARHFYPFRSKGKCRATREPSRVPSVMDGAEFWRECAGFMIGVGLGSTAATGSGSTQFINLIGLGVTAGGGIGNDSNANWRVGIGIGRKFGARLLGDGFSENAAAPAGESQIRYKTRDVTAPFAYFTLHW